MISGPAWKPWTLGIATGVAITITAGLVFGYLGFEVCRGVPGFAIPIAVCGVAGSVAVRIATGR